MKYRIRDLLFKNVNFGNVSCLRSCRGGKCGGTDRETGK